MRLGDAKIQIIDGDRGKNYPNIFSPKGYCLFLSAKNVTSTGFSFGEMQFITQECDDILRKGKLQRGDVVFTTRGTVGNVAYYDESVPYDNVRINSGMVILRANAEYVSPLFLYYTLKNKDTQLQITNARTGSAQPQYPISHMVHLEIDMPPLSEQIEIGQTLRALDDKIANNKAINNHLEQMAQAIFKSWFVDFEPWGGGMPSDWRNVSLGDLCIIVTKGTTPTTLKKQFVAHGINFIKAESILNDHSLDFSKLAFIDDETNALLNRSAIRENDIIFTIAGTLGRFAFVESDLLPANTNQAVAIIRADTSKINPIILYSFFIGGLHSDFYTKNIQQAVQANLSLTTIKALPLFLPPVETFLEYSELITPLFEQTFKNYSENRRLAALRDTLLPRLMSGELSIADMQISNMENK